MDLLGKDCVCDVILLAENSTTLLVPFADAPQQQRKYADFIPPQVHLDAQHRLDTPVYIVTLVQLGSVGITFCSSDGVCVFTVTDLAYVGWPWFRACCG